MLNERPRNQEEINNSVKRLAIRYGITIFLEDAENITEFSKIKQSLEFLLQEEMVRIDEGGNYSLTEKGILAAEKHAKKLSRFFKALTTLMAPSISPVLTLFVHLFLGIVKIIGFFITGSISLLGDGLDSCMDGISSILVGLAIKVKRETFATYLLLVLMTITGLGILGQGVDRLLNPIALEEETLAIIIAFVSIALCGLLYIYQRLSGYNNRSLAILAQSEDSKNHVLTAILVSIAVLASSIGIRLFDGIVGCFIGVIILLGAYEIFKDLRAQSQGVAINYEKYKLGIWKRYDKLQTKVLDLWLLFKVGKEINTLESLNEEFQTFFQPIVIKYTEDVDYIWKSPQQEEQLTERIQKLVEEDFLNKEDIKLVLTERGKKWIQKEINKTSKVEGSRKRTRRHEKKIQRLTK
ncbi:MAG: cation diffusion facilitator family transporter [Candidatus Hodarchaeales archaeon]|jgi:Co/Zn/Cd efflux system component